MCLTTTLSISSYTKLVRVVSTIMMGSLTSFISSTRARSYAVEVSQTCIIMNLYFSEVIIICIISTFSLMAVCSQGVHGLI